MTKCFENLIVGLQVLNTHVKFHANQILFNIKFINLLFICNLKYKNLKFKYLIDDIVIDFLSSENLVIVHIFVLSVGSCVLRRFVLLSIYFHQ